MKNLSSARILSAGLLLIITVVDIIIAVVNFNSGNLEMGICLLVMAAIILFTAIRTISSRRQNR